MRNGGTRWRAAAAAAALTAACGVTAACGGSSSASAAGAAGTAAGGTAAAGRPAAAVTGAARAAAACVTRTLGRLTLAQQVGQLFLVAVPGDAPGSALAAAEARYHFGSLLLNRSAAGTAALAGPSAGLRRLVTAAAAGVRPYIAANQEGGEVQQLTGPGFAAMPSALVQGGWTDSRLRAAAESWGTELRAAGVNLDLAPVMDVVPAATAAGNAPVGALDREFGSTPAGDGAHGAAVIRGLAQAGVSAVAKHFPGLGRVTGNTDFTAGVTDTVTTARDPDLGSFRAAIRAGVPMVMVSLATYARIDAARPAVFSPVVLGLLRGPLGFAGVIVSDDLGQASAVQAVPPGSRAVDFLLAGGDLVTSQALGPAGAMAAAVLARATARPAFRATVTAAARLVLTAKQAAGLLPC